jgi:hypothetical protein
MRSVEKQCSECGRRRISHVVPWNAGAEARMAARVRISDTRECITTSERPSGQMQGRRYIEPQLSTRIASAA